LDLVSHSHFNEKEYEEGQIGHAIACRITQVQRRRIWAEGWRENADFPIELEYDLFLDSGRDYNRSESLMPSSGLQRPFSGHVSHGGRSGLRGTSPLLIRFVS
jgi:hypothetical protein